jgi:hypothetical protein
MARVRETENVSGWVATYTKNSATSTTITATAIAIFLPITLSLLQHADWLNAMCLEARGSRCRVETGGRLKLHDCADAAELTLANV